MQLKYGFLLSSQSRFSRRFGNQVIELRRALEKKTANNISLQGRTWVTKHSEKSLVTCFLFLTGLSFHLRHLVNSEEADSVEKKILVNKVKICMYCSSLLQLSYAPINVKPQGNLTF